jgi:hypothetical protein
MNILVFLLYNYILIFQMYEVLDNIRISKIKKEDFLFYLLFNTHLIYLTYLRLKLKYFILNTVE